jgi:hypothetical protein
MKDIPIDFRVYLRKKAPNPFGVLRSKGIIHVLLIVHILFLLFQAVYIFKSMISHSKEIIQNLLSHLLTESLNSKIRDSTVSFHVSYGKLDVALNLREDLIT